MTGRAASLRLALGSGSFLEDELSPALVAGSESLPLVLRPVKRPANDLVERLS